MTDTGPKYGRGEFGGNQTYLSQGAIRRGQAAIRGSATDESAPGVGSTSTRDLPSFPWANEVQVPAGKQTQVLAATGVPRLVIICNVGMVPVYITNGNVDAPHGIRISAGDTIQFTTNQSVTLSAFNGANSFDPAVERQSFPGQVAVTG